MSEHQSSEFGTAISGLVGIVALVAAVYAVTVAQFSTNRDLRTQEQMAARIAPLGSVNLAGAEAAVPAPADEGPGVAIYNQACTTCHASGTAGAPKLGDKMAWEPRMARGVDELLRNAINGMGAMPPRGTCMDCSEDDLNVVIEYMLVQVGYEPAGSSVAGDTASADGMSGMESMTGMVGVSGMQGEQAREYQPGVQ